MTKEESVHKLIQSALSLTNGCPLPIVRELSVYVSRNVYSGSFGFLTDEASCFMMKLQELTSKFQCCCHPENDKI